MKSQETEFNNNNTSFLWENSNKTTPFLLFGPAERKPPPKQTWILLPQPRERRKYTISAMAPEVPGLWNVATIGETWAGL